MWSSNLASFTEPSTLDRMRYTRTLVGNRAVVTFLQKTLKNGIVPHAQLWIGPEHIGKTTFLINHLFQSWCEKQAACLRCVTCQQLQHDTHTGLRWLDGTTFDMATVREVLREAAETTFTTTQRAIVITQAELLSSQAWNALLKQLEEPRSAVTVYLLATTIDRLPATIISRCSIIRFHPVSDAELLLAWPEQGDRITLCHGRPGLVHKIRREEIDRWTAVIQQAPVRRVAALTEVKRDQAIQQLEHLETAVYWQVQQTNSPIAIQALRQIALARRSVQTNAQVKLVMTNLLLNIFPSI